MAEHNKRNEAMFYCCPRLETTNLGYKSGCNSPARYQEW